MSQQHTPERSPVKAGLRWTTDGLMRSYFLCDLGQMAGPFWPSDCSIVWMFPQKFIWTFNCHRYGINSWGLQGWLGHEGSTPYSNSTFLIKGWSQIAPLSAHLPFCLPSWDEDELQHLALDLPTSRIVIQTMSIIYYLPKCLEFRRTAESGSKSVCKF